MTAYEQAEHDAWVWDHTGYPDSRPHREVDPRCPICAAEGPFVDDASGLCPDCGLPLLDHLSADECEAHGIDAGLRDGLGCAVVTRVEHIRSNLSRFVGYSVDDWQIDAVLR